MLNDTHFYTYDGNGAVLYQNQHGYANPIIDATNTKKILVYDIGGYDFSLESKYKNIYKKRLENQIVFASVSDKGYVAVVTLSDKSLCMLSVFDNNGNPIYYYHCTDGRITNVEFTRSEDGVVVTSIGAEGGQFVSKVTRFKFNSEEPLWTTPKINTLAFNTFLQADGTLVLFGDNKCVCYDRNGEYIGEYVYRDTLIDYQSDDEITALLFENKERRTASLVVFSSITGYITEIEVTDAKAIETSGQNVYVMMDKRIVMYNSSGEEINDVKISSDYDEFRKIGDHIYLMGYSDVDRIDFKE